MQRQSRLSNSVRIPAPGAFKGASPLLKARARSSRYSSRAANLTCTTGGADSSRLDLSSIDVHTYVLSSDDPAHSTPLQFDIHAYANTRGQGYAVTTSWLQLPESLAVARFCPLLAAAVAVPGIALLTAPQQALQLLAGPGCSSPTSAVAALATCFGRLVGLTCVFQALVTLMVQGCASRAELGSTSCHRMLMASLLPLTGNLLALNKVAAAGCTATGVAGVAVLQLATFAVHVLLHLQHHPWFIVKVMWPLAVTMLITELIPTNWTFVEGGSGGTQAMLAAVLSVKLVSRLSRVAARFAPKLAKKWLAALVTWIARRVLPRITARLAKVVPHLARKLGQLIPKLARFGSRLAGRMAPRYAQDQLAGRTQQWAFPSADGLLTDTVAKSIDLLPPRNTVSWVYVGLMLGHLLMIVNAYSPDLLFNTAALTTAAAAATKIAATGSCVVVEAGAAAAAAATSAGAAAAVPGGVWVALLRFAKYTWGSGFFVAAFACNCLKTAADRQHLWKPSNRQLNLGVALLQAGTAAALLLGIEAGAVLPSIYAVLHIAAATAGACFCCAQAARPGLNQQQLLQAALAAAAATPTASIMASAVDSIHLPQQEEQQGQQIFKRSLSVKDVGSVGASFDGGSRCTIDGMSISKAGQLHTRALLTQAAGAAAACAQQGEGFSKWDSRPSNPISSLECEAAERTDPSYASVLSTTALLLTLLQLTL